mmetsp:Transcript_34654/g.102971  ORF Transcript_34654/g.102971 Transcript_34654/m.102971 type:complete len:263 (+) Transcript_34654:1122-1910(+)
MKSKIRCAMPRPLAAFAATVTQASHFSRKASASVSALENQRTRSVCCSRSSAKPRASSRAAASRCADFPACFAPARAPCNEPVTSKGHTAALSFHEAMNIAAVPPTTEDVNRTTSLSFVTASAHFATSLSKVATALGVAPDSACAAGSARSLATKTSAASLARMRSAVLSKMKVRMQPAAAPQPKSSRLAVRALRDSPGGASMALRSCAPVRKFTKEATTSAPAPMKRRGASAVRWWKSQRSGSNMAPRLVVSQRVPRWGGA